MVKNSEIFSFFVVTLINIISWNDNLNFVLSINIEIQILRLIGLLTLNG